MSDFRSEFRPLESYYRSLAKILPSFRLKMRYVKKKINHKITFPVFVSHFFRTLFLCQCLANVFPSQVFWQSQFPPDWQPMREVGLSKLFI